MITTLIKCVGFFAILLLGHSKDNPNVLCAAIAYLGRVTSN
jgi:hypothetical protein